MSMVSKREFLIKEKNPNIAMCFYTNKALFTIKDMKMLGNSTRKLYLLYKYFL